ncbi:MAG: 50S ribosomal protein L44e [Candidatus Micrarchaeota archaeon]|nr:50S ribosomal protein L44e [Candidatus Micrarchaeota archaeon]
MKIPKTQNRFCPHCRKHTEHELHRVRVSKKKRSLAEGQRRFKRKLKGYGSFPKPNPRGREKPTRKVDLRYECKECGKQHTVGEGFRVKKFEVVK